jgi:hypothetical protein
VAMAPNALDEHSWVMNGKEIQTVHNFIKLKSSSFLFNLSVNFATSLLGTFPLRP